MTSPQAVARMIDQRLPKLARLGFVTAVDVTNQLVTVAFEDGSTTSSLSWVSSAYTPTVGDRVKVSNTSTGWVVDGKVTPRPQLIVDQQIRVPVRNNWQGQISDQPGSSWWWGDDAAAPYLLTSGWQGQVPPQQGGDGYVQTEWLTRSSVLGWGPLASLVPSGATISQLTVTLRAEWLQRDLVAPVLYGHAYTATPSGPPSFVSGFGPLRFPRMALGETQTITLPASWVTAWLAGTLQGVGLYSTSQADGAYFGDAWHTSEDGINTIWDTRDNAVLGITYSGGTT